MNFIKRIIEHTKYKKSPEYISYLECLDLNRKDVIRLSGYYDACKTVYEEMLNNHINQDSKEFLDNYLNNYYNESFMTKIISSYTDLLINKIEELKLSLEEFSYYVDGTYYTKVLETLNPPSTLVITRFDPFGKSKIE